MCQAQRQFRKPVPSRETAAVLILLLLSCALAVPGCALSGLNDSFSSDHSFLPTRPSTIRSQSSAATDDIDRRATATFAADYGPLRASTGSRDGITGELSEVTGNVPVDATGHSFVQRRARLGRPIPLPDKKATPPDTAFVDAVVADQPGRLNFENGGWQPIQDQSSSQEPDRNNENRSGQSLVTESNASIDTETLSPSGASTTFDSVDEPIESGSTENDVQITKEPTVLDRIKGFYTPRREETPLERNRKATRRWTDPFGLLREREPENGEAAVGATTPLPAHAESGTSTAESRDSSPALQGSQDLLEPLIAQLERELAEWPKLPGGSPGNEVEWLRRQTDLRMLYLIAGRSAESIQVIESLPEKEQEFWQSMMLAMESYRRNDEATPRTDQLAETLEYIRTASRQLQPLSTMRIRRLNFCNRIDGFGAISVFPISDFNAGQPLLLYAEIENYKSELTSDGQYRSEFDAMIEFIRAGETEPITDRTIRLPEIEDLCSAERTDYFQSYQLTVPVLSPGKYILRLRIRDQLSQQTATIELPFDIRPLGSSQ